MNSETSLSCDGYANRAERRQALRTDRTKRKRAAESKNQAFKNARLKMEKRGFEYRY